MRNSATSQDKPPGKIILIEAHVFFLPKLIKVMTTPIVEPMPASAAPPAPSFSLDTVINSIQSAVSFASASLTFFTNKLTQPRPETSSKLQLGNPAFVNPSLVELLKTFFQHDKQSKIAIGIFSSDPEKQITGDGNESYFRIAKQTFADVFMHESLREKLKPYQITYVDLHATEVNTMMCEIKNPKREGANETPEMTIISDDSALLKKAHQAKCGVPMIQKTGMLYEHDFFKIQEVIKRAQLGAVKQSIFFIIEPCREKTEKVNQYLIDSITMLRDLFSKVTFVIILSAPTDKCEFEKALFSKNRITLDTQIEVMTQKIGNILSTVNPVIYIGRSQKIAHQINELNIPNKIACLLTSEQENGAIYQSQKGIMRTSSNSLVSFYSADFLNSKIKNNGRHAAQHSITNDSVCKTTAEKKTPDPACEPKQDRLFDLDKVSELLDSDSDFFSSSPTFRHLKDEENIHEKNTRPGQRAED